MSWIWDDFRLLLPQLHHFVITIGLSSLILLKTITKTLTRLVFLPNLHLCLILSIYNNTAWIEYSMNWIHSAGVEALFLSTPYISSISFCMSNLFMATSPLIFRASCGNSASGFLTLWKYQNLYFSSLFTDILVSQSNAISVSYLSVVPLSSLNFKGVQDDC